MRARQLPCTTMRHDDRWRPDDQLIPAVLTGSKTLTDLRDGDRATAIIGATNAGLTVTEIADKLHCSPRVVHTIRASDLAAAIELLTQREHDYANEMRLLRSERAIAAAARTQAEAEVKRLSGQLARALRVARPQCAAGHTLDGYNTYWHRGRRYCRECHRQRQARYRQPAHTSQR